MGRPGLTAGPYSRDSWKIAWADRPGIPAEVGAAQLSQALADFDVEIHVDKRLRRELAGQQIVD